MITETGSNGFRFRFIKKKKSLYYFSVQKTRTETIVIFGYKNGTLLYTAGDVCWKCCHQL